MIPGVETIDPALALPLAAALLAAWWLLARYQDRGTPLT